MEADETSVDSEVVKIKYLTVASVPKVPKSAIDEQLVVVLKI